MEGIPSFPPELVGVLALDLAATVPMWLEGTFLTRGSLFLDPVAVPAGRIEHDLPPGSLRIPGHLAMRSEERPAVLRSDGTVAFWPVHGRMIGRRGPVGPMSALGVTMSGVLAVLPDGRIEVTRRWHATTLIAILTFGLAPYLLMLGSLPVGSLLCMLAFLPGVPLAFYFAVLWWNYRQLEVVLWRLLDELRAPSW